METLLLMTNAEAANTLALVAWVLTFFIVLNIGLLAYTMIRNSLAAKRGTSPAAPKKPEKEKKKKGLSLSKAPKEPAAEPVRSENVSQAAAPVPPAPVSTVPDEEGEYLPEGTFQISLTDLANPERTFYAEGKASYLVGRRPQMDLCIPDDGYVSGTHCKFELEDGDLYLTDLESSNGTKVNGEKITEKTKVTEDDIVRIGKLEYKVKY